MAGKCGYLGGGSFESDRSANGLFVKRHSGKHLNCQNIIAPDLFTNFLEQGFKTKSPAPAYLTVIPTVMHCNHTAKPTFGAPKAKYDGFTLSIDASRHTTRNVVPNTPGITVVPTGRSSLDASCCSSIDASYHSSPILLVLLLLSIELQCNYSVIRVGPRGQMVYS